MVNTVKFICLTVFVFVFISQVSCLGLRNKCNCGPTSGGSEHCSCQDVVIRPPLPRKMPIPRIHETAGSSLQSEEAADHVRIQPAPLPKYSSSPYHKLESPYKFDNPEAPYPYHTFYPRSRGPSKFTEYETHANGDYAEEEDDGYYYKHDKLRVAPADAVSRSLAYEFAKRAGAAVKEEGLHFGHRTIPKDGAVIKGRKDIPEDRLYGYDKQIVEFRHPSAKYGLSHYGVEAEEEYGESKHGGSTNYLSYADLGYVPETPRKQHQFSVGPIDRYNDHVVPYEDKEAYLRPHPQPCQQRGHVRVRKHEIEDLSEEEGSPYSWEDKEEGHHPRFKAEHYKKGHVPANKFQAEKDYAKHV